MLANCSKQLIFKVLKVCPGGDFFLEFWENEANMEPRRSSGMGALPKFNGWVVIYGQSRRGSFGRGQERVF
jgi:hypothetical protein